MTDKTMACMAFFCFIGLFALAFPARAEDPPAIQEINEEESVQGSAAESPGSSYDLIRNMALDAETKALFEKEAPLAQEDIDFYLEALPLLSLEDADSLLDSLAASKGIEMARVKYVFAKTGLALILLSDPSVLDSIPPDSEFLLALPSPEETKLVEDNLADLEPILRTNE
jgi:hypothetical protein